MYITKTEQAAIVADQNMRKEEKMKYSEALEKLNLTTPKSLEENGRLASWLLKTMPRGMPLSYKVAAMVVIRAADEYKESA